MKRCKGNCGRPLGLMDGDYCKECLERQPLYVKLRESLKEIKSK